MPMSANSKIGAFGSLLMATIVPGALHADLVLDGAGDAGRDVELRRHRLARLADLGRVRVPAGVDHCARRGDGAAERLRELLELREALRPTEAASAGDDDVGVLDGGPRLLLGVVPGKGRRRREVLQLGDDVGHLARTLGGTGSKLPARKSAMAGFDRQLVST